MSGRGGLLARGGVPFVDVAKSQRSSLCVRDGFFSCEAPRSGKPQEWDGEWATLGSAECQVQVTSEQEVHDADEPRHERINFEYRGVGEPTCVGFLDPYVFVDFHQEPPGIV